MTRIIPKGSRFWDESGPQVLLQPNDVQKAYEEGWVGAWNDPDEHESLLQENKALTGYGTIEDAATANNWAGSGRGKLSIPFVHVMEAFPGCWPGMTGQSRGDCVSWGGRNAGLGSMVCEVVAGKPDEVTGKVEALPDVPPIGIRNGVFSTEALYWYRRHGGDGWFCGSAAKVMQKESGLWIRKNYPELGIDLTKYDGRTAGKWGRTPPTGKVAEQGTMNLVRAFAEAKTGEARRDALANGYFGFTCGSESFSNRRDKNGVSDRTRAGWAHSMCDIAFDDRPEMVKEYKSSLILILNSWGVWNTGPRDIWDSAKYVPPGKKDLWIECDLVNPSTGNIMIPKGSFWARTKDVSRREWLATSSVNGWPQKELDNWGWFI